MTMGATGPDTLTICAAAAVQTTRVRLGTSIVPAFTRHPLAVVSQVLALDDLAHGRLRLGLGVSHAKEMRGRYGLEYDKPLSQLREYLKIVRAALNTGEVDFSGEFYTAKANYPATPATPLLISALRPHAFEAAGELTEGAISWITPLDYLTRVAIPAMERGAEKAGQERPPLVTHVSVALAGSREEAREAARKELAYYTTLPFYQNMFAASGFPLGPDNGYSDALLDQLVIAGDEDTVAAELVRLLDGGFDELLVMPIPVSDREGEERRLIELIGRL
jgi:F420-dependent oxidoreductase-like protein